MAEHNRNRPGLRYQATTPQPPYIGHVPDEVAAQLEKLAARADLPLSTFALQELTESPRRADNTELLNAGRLARAPGIDCTYIPG